MVAHNDLQQMYLELLVHDKIDVSIYLVSGIKLTGQIIAHDEQVLVLASDIESLIFKHAVSSILPVCDIALPVI